MLVFVACYAPNPPAGNPCTEDVDCPSPLVCAGATLTCERVGGPDIDGDVTIDGPGDVVDGPMIDTQLIDGCSPATEICGDGIDQDCTGADLTCAANDVAAGAVNITAGGMFPGDAMRARDDVSPSGCGGSGGRDLFYKVTLTSPEVYYFDTYGSNFDSVLRVYAQPCAMVAPSTGAVACSNDSCGETQSHVAIALPAGESCVVVDQRTGGEMTGTVSLAVTRGGRNGMPLATGGQVLTGDTCSATNTSDGIDMNCDEPGVGGKDNTYFFTTCPGQTLLLDASTCNAATQSWDSVLYVKRVNGDQLGCNDDSCSGWTADIRNVTINNSRLYFLFIDGYDPGQCGSYQLFTNLRSP